MHDENSLKAVSTSQAEYEEGDVSIQCIQSSEFVLGKQTNFNGPVTLINCVDTPEEGNPEIINEHNEEKIVIRDKVLSQSGTEKDVPEKEPKKDKGDRTDKFQDRVIRKLKKVSMIPVFLCCGLVVAAAIVLVVFLVTSPTGEPESIKIGSHVLYTKKAWGGKPPRSTVEMKLPIPYAVVSHSVTTQCFHLKTCSILIQNMQNYHLTLDFADIGYNFLVDSSGNIYEGRGWNIRNVKGGFVNGRNIDIGLIGDYSDNAYPTHGLIEGLKDLLEFGLQSGILSKTYSLIASNSTYSTLSPGQNVYAIIKNWPHFDPDPKSHVKEYEF